MAVLLSGLPVSVPGTTINRLCGSGMDAIGQAARAIRAGDCDLMIAGGVESMSRAPFVDAQGRGRLLAVERDLRHHDRLAFRQSEDEEGRGVSTPCRRPRTMSRRTSASAAPTRTPSPREARPAGPRRRTTGRFADEIVPVTIPQKKGEPIVVSVDEHPRPGTTAETLGQAQGRQRPRPQRHRRQRLRRQRRRRRAGHRLRGRREGARPDAARRASSRWPPPASSRASWASARRRPRAACWRAPGCRSTRWT